MTPLFLALIIAALFAILLAYESGVDDTGLQLRPAGLLTWLTSGNWPAKVGAGLMIIGVGALLRYAFANIDLPPETKLGGGIAAAALLGLGSFILKSQPTRRAIHLALAGAAFGVAYLTAYSAYGFFNYITDVNALALLALVAVAAGVFAVKGNVMSVAILAMIGAYIAPKFALGTPGVLPVYGYYLAASVLSLVMVTLRGWRPLIHLSFLFTLAGALFFGWSGKFYEPEHYGYMQPLLLALTAVHLAMPLLERKFTRSARFMQFDVAYFTMLPLVAAALTLKIAPNLHAEGAVGLGALALIWGMAAAILTVNQHPESTRHAMVGALLATAAALSYFQDLPWLLVGLGLSVTTIVVASHQDWPRRIEELACGAATVFGILHIIQSVLLPDPSRAFLSEMFAHRLLAGTLMIFGAWAGSRRKMSFASVLGVIGLGWVLLAFVAEFVRLDIDYLPQLGYGMILAMLVLHILFGDRIPASATIGGLLIFVLIGLGWVAAADASAPVALACIALTPAVLLGLAWSGRTALRDDVTDFAPTIAIGLLPFALVPWAFATAEFAGVTTGFYEIGIAMIGVAAAGLAGRYWLNDSERWNDRIQPLHVYLTAIALLWVTLFHIERGIWPIVFEILALGYLIAYVSRRTREQAGVSLGVGAITTLSVALVLQAMLLRGFGPDDFIMTASDINKMHLPAVASLMWVIFGSGLAWWGTNTKDRSVWSIGAGLLVVAAIKLVLFDFGTLGQLGNIVAFIVAGMVFMGVAWFAPIPPKAERAPEPRAVPQPAPPAKAAGEQPVETKVEQKAAAQSPGQAPRPGDSKPADGHQPRAGVYRTYSEPKGTNWLWLLILGLAIAVALFYSAQHKRARPYKAYEERNRITDVQKMAQMQLSDKPAAAPSAPVMGSPETPVVEQLPPQSRSSATAAPAAPPVARADACANFTGQLPSDFAVYAAGAYSGRKISHQIDQSGHSGTQIDVDVHQPGKPVVLILGAYEPTIWNISLSPETELLAVLVGGYHRQVIAGLSPRIPSLISTYDNRGPCGYFYITQNSAGEINPLAKRVFGRSVDAVYPVTDGKVVIGEFVAGRTRLLPSSGPRPEAYYDKAAPLAGEAGLEDAVLNGVLRRATEADGDAWVAALGQSFLQRDIPYVTGQGLPAPQRPSAHNAYVVLGTFTYPSGLYGAHSATFLIPKGVARPTGNLGHSTVYDFNTLSCQGVQCRNR